MKRFSQTVVQIKNADGDFEPIAALRGMSSYECAVQNGFEGTEDDWLEMMIGDGWVGKFQELEANKANKTDVYTSAQTDELLQGVFDQLAMQNLGNLVIQKIQESTTWTAPKSVGQLFKVFCVGGGGGGGQYSSTNNSDYHCGGGGGGSGYIEIAELTIDENTEIDIICGAGGDGYVVNYIDASLTTYPSDGGATSFGDLLTAEGGKKGGDATKTSCGNGGDGGAGGGGGGGGNPTTLTSTGNGGDGGKYGGGGGAGYGWSNKGSSVGGTGGEYGGNGGDKSMTGINGRAFADPIVNVLFDIHKVSSGSTHDICKDNSGNTYGYPGSGGYGGNGGRILSSTYGGSGGGGYCGNGGDCMSGSGGGGGGGYCGNGGNSYSSGGGGGGFFCDGGDACPTNNMYGSGGGGGFFCDGGEGGVSSSGSGGNGGVLIMYIKED